MRKSSQESVPVFARRLDSGGFGWATRIVLVIVLIMFFFPMFWLIETAFKEHLDFVAIPPKIFFTPTLENFRAVLEKADFGTAYKNSALITSISVTLALFFGLPAAYGLSRFRFPGQSVLSFWILSTRFIPPVVVVIPFFIIFRFTGMTDTMYGMVMVHLVAALPLVIWIMYSFFKDVPFEIEEAACVDGAHPIYTFVRIAMPLVAPGIVATTILAIQGSWNELIYAVILTSVRTRTLPVTIYRFVSYEQIAWGNLCAGGVLAIAPIVIVTVCLQKYLLAGLTFGAVKS